MWTAELESELQRVGTSARRRLDAGAGKLDVTRVSQLDAVMLDSELTALLKAQSEQVFKHLPEWSQTVARAQPEINAFLRLVLWVYSHRVNAPSPGDALQNLRYRDERLYDAPHKRGLMSLPGDLPSRWQRLLHGMGSVLVPWGWERLRETALVSQWSALPEEDWRSQAASAMDRAERAYAVASLANLLVFFYNGKYRSILDRVLKMRVVYAKPEAHRPVSFEFINQQLLYDGFSEMLMCLLPLVDWERLRRLLSTAAARASAFAAVYVLPRMLAAWRSARRVVRRFARRYRRARAARQAPSPDSHAAPGDQGIGSERDGAQEAPDRGVDDDSASDSGGDDSSWTEAAVSEDDGSSSIGEPAGESLVKSLPCASCGKDHACMPYRTSCGHVFCYFCLKTAQMKSGQGSFPCVSCGQTIESSRRL